MKVTTPYPHRLIIRDTGEVCTPGFDYETNRISVLCENQNAIVLKVPGRSVWSGNYCPRRHVPPEVMVFGIVRQTREGKVRTLIVEPLIGWETGRSK